MWFGYIPFVRLSGNNYGRLCSRDREGGVYYVIHWGQMRTMLFVTRHVQSANCLVLKYSNSVHVTCGEL